MGSGLRVSALAVALFMSSVSSPRGWRESVERRLGNHAKTGIRANRADLPTRFEHQLVTCPHDGQGILTEARGLLPFHPDRVRCNGRSRGPPADNYNTRIRASAVSFCIFAYSLARCVVPWASRDLLRVLLGPYFERAACGADGLRV